MSEGDFRSTELSVTVPDAVTVRIEHVATDGNVTTLKDGITLLPGEIVDGAVMRAAALDQFLRGADQRRKGAGRALQRPPEGDDDEGLGPDPLRARCQGVFPGAEGGRLEPQRRSRRASGRHRDPVPADGPGLAMVDSDRGITNLHVPSDVIIDASMPAAIRASGQMWNAAGDQQDAKYVIPDTPTPRSTRRHLSTAGPTAPWIPRHGHHPNVGLMAQAAEEYGSHDRH